METPRDIFTVTPAPALVSALGFLHFLRFCISLFLPEVDDEPAEDHKSGRGMVAPNLRLTCAFVAFKLYMKTPYQRPVTSRCYVTSFRKHCDAYAEIIDDEVEQTLKDLNIHQFLKFPAFQQCIPLLFEVLKFWSPADEGFIVLGHVLKFTSDEVALLIGMPNRGIDIKWRIDPLNGPLSTEVKTDIAKLDRLADNATKIKTFIMFLLSNLFFPLNSHKTPRRLTTVANNLSEFASINWASSLRNFMVEEFNTIFEKYKLQRPLGYINGFFPLLLIWFLEHFSLNKPTDSELRPRFLRWQGYTELYFTQENAAKIFKFLKISEIFACLENVSNEEAEKYGADIIAIKNSETRSGHEPLKLQSPQKIKASARKKLVTTPPPSPLLSPPLSPDSPHIEPPKTQTPPPSTQPSTRPPTQKISISQPSAEQPPITRADLEAVQNKYFEIFEKMLNKIQENVGARLDRLEDNVEKLQADQDSMKYKFIEFQMQCDHNQEKPHISSSASSFQSVNNMALHPSAQAPIQVVHPPPPMVKGIPPPPPMVQEIPPPPPPPIQVVPPPPPIQVVPPPPPMVQEIPPPPPVVQEIPPPPPIQVVPPPKRKREDGEKEESSSKKVVPYVKKNTKEVISVDNIIVESHPALEIMDYPGKPFLAEQKQQFMDECFKKFNTKEHKIFVSGNIEIKRSDIDILLTNDWLGDNHVDAFAYFLLEQSRLMAEKFQRYLYISPLYMVYKSLNLDYQIFIEHINPVSVQQSKLIVQPIIYEKHWVLLVGKLKEKVWKLYDSLSNPEHKHICHKVINYLHEDAVGCFSSDITKWNVQAVRGIPTQTNSYDCGIFVCKYMEKAVLRKKTDWSALKDWQKHMPKFRAELAYFLFLQTKK
ncbi:hypothetical protein KFK09_028818 [Dendrobium nobile]|uniref:Ubiquitin-like protease family profile domain-containing protein n=1 Tax=Dendrobium nobile TaxID=94219 RepID=A0A8T3A438_DENNO|nr:hypothetical protein KFK09_028818 [Dendrobium nobile]